jgi:ribonuclease-3
VNVEALGQRLGVEIEAALLELALTHRSYAYEHGGIPDNERLEFLGDSVLGFVVTAHLHDSFTNLDEDELTKLKSAVVSAKALASIAEPLGIGEFLRLGKGEIKTGGRSKANLLADAFEALLGAIYVSAGLDVAAEVVRKYVFPLLEDPETLLANADPKTSLAELANSLALGSVHYETVAEGPDHDRYYRTQVLVASEVLGEGAGRSKKSSEADAAAVAVAHLRRKHRA